MQGATENIVYAIIGPFSSDQSRTSETFKLDEDRVKYAKINYSEMQLGEKLGNNIVN